MDTPMNAQCVAEAHTWEEALAKTNERLKTKQQKHYISRVPAWTFREYIWIVRVAG